MREKPNWLRRPAIALLLLALCAAAMAQTRVQPPQFDVPYVAPAPSTQPPRVAWMEIVDVAVLVAMMSLAAYFLIKLRSRGYVLGLAIAALAYFGFYRKGCICAIGAIQNVGLALGNPAYVVPITVVLFIALPLVFALLFGRVFCGGACPLGMIQDVVLVKPLNLPKWLAEPLGFIPFIYLGLGVMLAATGTAFVICRYDPFVPFFRLSGTMTMLVAGFVVLALGTVIGRPYCRFACPYGAALGLLSRVAWKHVTVTPDDCVVCGLCENACPFGAIDKPSPKTEVPALKAGKSVTIALIIALPIVGATLGWFAGPTVSRLDDTVALAERVQAEDAGAVSGFSFESDYFRSTGTPVAKLYEQADRVRGTFALATALFGAWVGLVFALKIWDFRRKRQRREYVIRNADCVGCGRCLKACPREWARLRKLRIKPATGEK